MIRRSPAEAYIKYLLLHPKKYTNDDIKEILRYAQLDALGDYYLNRLRGVLHPPKPFYLFDKNHKASRSFVLREGIAQLATPDEHGKKAFQILEKPRVKEFVEAALISNAPPAAIAHAVTRAHRMQCHPTTIERFRAFFWDVSLIDSTELRALLKLRFEHLDGTGDPELAKQHPILKNAYWQDSRRAAANLPFSPMSALLAQMRMGVMPSRIDVAKIIEQTQGIAALRLYEAVTNDGKGDSKKALDLSIVVEKTTAVLKEVTQHDEDVRKQLSAIALRTDENPVPTVHMLSQGGSFTTDVGPKETPNELPADADDGDAGAGDPEAAG